MASISRLSDEDLHRHLLQLGITTPVTATTRPLLVKKLMQAKIDGKIKISPKKTTSQPRSLQVISSDEEEQEEDEDDDEDQQFDDDTADEEPDVSFVNRSSGRLNKSNLFKYNNSKDDGNTPKRGANGSIGVSTPMSSKKATPTVRSRQLRTPVIAAAASKTPSSATKKTAKLFPSVSSPRSPTAVVTSRNITVTSRSSNNNYYDDDDTASDTDTEIMRHGSKRRKYGSYSYSSLSSSYNGQNDNDYEEIGPTDGNIYEQIGPTDGNIYEQIGPTDGNIYEQIGPTDGNNYEDDEVVATDAFSISRRTTTRNNNNNNSRNNRIFPQSLHKNNNNNNNSKNRIAVKSNSYECEEQDSDEFDNNKRHGVKEGPSWSGVKARGNKLFSSLSLPTFVKNWTTARLADVYNSNYPANYPASYPATPSNYIRQQHYSSTPNTTPAVTAPPGWQQRLRSMTSVSSLLLSLLMLFFVALTMSYVNKKTMTGDMPTISGGMPAISGDTPTIAGQHMEKDGFQLPVCPPHHQLAGGAVCLTLEEVSVVQRVLPYGRRLVVEAQRCYTDYQCDVTALPYMTVQEAGGWLQQQAGLEKLTSSETVVAVTAFAKLSIVNPSIGLEPVYETKLQKDKTTKSTGSNLVSNTHHSSGSSDPGSNLPSGEGGGEGVLLGLRTRTRQLHILCAVMNATKACLYVITLLGLGGAVFYFVTSLVRKLQHKRYQYNQDLYRLVEQVVFLVQSRDQVAVSHVRDQMFVPRDRLAKRQLWEKVVAFVDQHESRMVMEVRVVGGEETDVWRWIGQKEDTTTFLASPLAAEIHANQSQGLAANPASPLVRSHQRGNQSQGFAANPASPLVRGHQRGDQSQGVANSASPLVRGHQRGDQSQSCAANPASPLVPGEPASSPVANRKPAPSMYPKVPVYSEDEDEMWQGAGVSRRRSAVQAVTRCLKIRHMYVGHSSPATLQSAIVNKCRGYNILHLAVDPDSSEGVVYLMADTVKAAGGIHSLLHGCWFQGELVAVKFLRDERYKQRFPAAEHCTIAMRG